MERKTFWIIFCMGISLFCCAKEKLAVVDFAENGKLKSAQAGKIVANLFGAALSDKYTLLERMQINKIITEQRFSLSDLVGNKSKAKRLGKLLGADKLVVGNVSALGTTITVDARVVDVNSGSWSERAYIYCGGLGEIPKNLPTLLSKMKLLGDGGVSVPMPTHASGPISYRDQTFLKYLSVGHAKLKSGDLKSAKNMAASASKIPGYQYDKNVKFLLQLIKQEETRRYDEAVAKGFKIKVDKKLLNSSSPVMLTKYVEGLGKIKIAIFMRRNDLYVRIGRNSSRLKLEGGSYGGDATGIAEFDKFKIIVNLYVEGKESLVKWYGNTFVKHFRLDAFQIGNIQGIRKDLY